MVVTDFHVDDGGPATVDACGRDGIPDEDAIRTLEVLGSIVRGTLRFTGAARDSDVLCASPCYLLRFGLLL